MRTLTARRSATSASSHSRATAPPRARASAPRTRAATSSVAQVTQPAQQVMDLVGRAGRALLGQRLQLQLQLGQRLGIEQLAQLLRAQQLAQQVAVERERLGPPVEQRRVALVHVGGDVVEQQRRGEGRGARRLDAHHADLAPLDGRQQLAQRRQVEDVLEHLAVGLEDDGERAVAAGHRQQLRGALAHLPQRRALARPPTRQQQRPGGVLAEAAGEQRRAADRLGHQLLDLVGGDEHGRLRAAGPAEARPRRARRRRRSRAGARRCRRRTRWAGPPPPATLAAEPRWPAPRARAPVPRTASAGTRASRPARRGSAAARRSCRWAGRR